MERLSRFDRRSLAFGAFALAALLAVVSSPQLLGDELGDALAELATASPGWLWIAAACFLASLSCMGCAWRVGVRSCGGEIDAVGATARYAAGSFANSIAPAGCGGALRIALFSRVLPHRERLWTAGGITAAVTAARAASVAALVAGAAALGRFPVWPVLLLGGVGAVAGAVALATRRCPARSRIAHAFDVFRALGSAPARAVTLFGWVALAVLARLAAAEADFPASVEASLQRWYAGTDTDPALVQQTRATLLANDVASYLNCYRVFATADAEIGPELPRIATPALAVTGELDSGSTPEMTRRLAAAMPDCRAVVVPGARHMLPVQRPRELVTLLTTFIWERRNVASGTV